MAATVGHDNLAVSSRRPADALNEQASPHRGWIRYQVIGPDLWAAETPDARNPLAVASGWRESRPGLCTISALPARLTTRDVIVCGGTLLEEYRHAGPTADRGHLPFSRPGRVEGQGGRAGQQRPHQDPQLEGG